MKETYLRLINNPTICLQKNIHTKFNRKEPLCIQKICGALLIFLSFITFLVVIIHQTEIPEGRDFTGGIVILCLGGWMAFTKTEVMQFSTNYVQKGNALHLLDDGIPYNETITSVKWNPPSSGSTYPVSGTDFHGNKWYRNIAHTFFIVSLNGGGGGCGLTQEKAWENALRDKRAFASKSHKGSAVELIQCFKTFE